MAKKVYKCDQVLKHLKDKGNITSWEAINKYGATRLSDIIFRFKKNLGLNIVTESVTEKDRNGNTVTFAKYVLKNYQTEMNL